MVSNIYSIRRVVAKSLKIRFFFDNIRYDWTLMRCDFMLASCFFAFFILGDCFLGPEGYRIDRRHVL